MGKLARIARSAADRWAGLDGLAKIVGVVSAGIAVVIGAGQLYSVLTSSIAAREELARLIRIGDSQLDDRDYSRAWQSNATALKLVPRDDAAAAQQARIAMRWLESMNYEEPSVDAIAPLEDALSGRALTARGHEWADVQAHIGWAHFLRRYDDNARGIAVLEKFDAALREDPANAYGHLMKGFVILYHSSPEGRHEAMKQGRAHFDAALDSGVDPSYCDAMINAALFSTGSSDDQLIAVEYANRTRKAGRKLSARVRYRLINELRPCCSDIDSTPLRLLRDPPLDETISTINWIFSGDCDANCNSEAGLLKGSLLQLSGRTSEAVAEYRAMLSASPDGSWSSTARDRLTSLGLAPDK
jgi:tetratricopeptide (TPR) repeat protein